MLARAVILVYYLVLRRILRPALQVTLVSRLISETLRSTNVVVRLCMFLHLIPVNRLSFCTV
jgi:hypothetical protein